MLCDWVKRLCFKIFITFTASIYIVFLWLINGWRISKWFNYELLRWGLPLLTAHILINSIQRLFRLVSFFALTSIFVRALIWKMCDFWLSLNFKFLYKISVAFVKNLLIRKCSKHLLRSCPIPPLPLSLQLHFLKPTLFITYPTFRSVSYLKQPFFAFRPQQAPSLHTCCFCSPKGALLVGTALV